MNTKVKIYLFIRNLLDYLRNVFVVIIGKCIRIKKCGIKALNIYWNLNIRLHRDITGDRWGLGWVFFLTYL